MGVTISPPFPMEKDQSKMADKGAYPEGRSEQSRSFQFKVNVNLRVAWTDYDFEGQGQCELRVVWTDNRFICRLIRTLLEYFPFQKGQKDIFL